MRCRCRTGVHVSFFVNHLELSLCERVVDSREEDKILKYLANLLVPDPGVSILLHQHYGHCCLILLKINLACARHYILSTSVIVLWV